jgi:hypothetical protein
MPRQDPHIELLVFTRLDANQPPIRLSGFTFQAIGEQMFPEFRSVGESPADQGDCAILGNLA